MTDLEPDLPGDYAAALTTLKDLVREAQHRAQRVVNTALLELYWNIGHTILQRQHGQPWGATSWRGLHATCAQNSRI